MPFYHDKAAPYPADTGDFSNSISANGHAWNSTPIAICGIALRLPGGISTPSHFWDFLINKRDARGPIPGTRFKASSFYSPSGKPGFIHSQHGYFLDESVDLGALDTSFFSMPKTEVERADPQQRLLLELAWECFESAGEVDYRGKAIGTYIGSFGEDWAENFSKDTNIFGPYKITGYGDFTAPNRISYEYDLRGPSMSIRTGCSSALIGLHEACLAIQSGQCEAALVGGCNLIMSPGMTVSMSEQGILSPHGSCRTFDALADGYARGEAINLLYIKSLSEALRDGNPVRAIIRGTSTNADGKTTGISVPSHVSHEAMMRKAYERAGLTDAISDTGFVECHGTGTPTGDPIETKAVGNVFGERGVWIGSVKPNVGHSEGASGITSVVKAVLALEHRTIPPNIKFVTPNPKIPFGEKNLKVPTHALAWPDDRRERVSVNSFGIGGANAHVVLESASEFLDRHPRDAGRDATATPLQASPRLHLIPFSTNTAVSLQRQVVTHQQYLAAKPSSLADVAYTRAARRVHLLHRAYAVVRDGTGVTVSPPARAPSSCPEIVMTFTGQGAQWPQMGMELMRSNAKFASSIRYMDGVLRGLADAPSWTLEEELFASPGDSHIMEASFSQPICTALQVALVDALSDVGIHPYAVVGHSSGEIAAAYAAGRITSAEAISIAFYRGLVSSEVRTPGCMAAVGMSWSETARFLVPGASIACENGPSNVTISGDTEAVEDTLKTILGARPSVFCRRLKVDTAYHSHHMKEVGEKYFSLLSTQLPTTSRPSQPGVLLFSTVTGAHLPDPNETNARYWQANMESPVLFHQAVAALLLHHHRRHHDHHPGPSNSAAAGLVFLEVGPHRALSGPLRQILSQSGISYPYQSCLTRYQDPEETFLSAIGWLWLHGISPDFERLTNHNGRAKVVEDLPLYPWHHDHSLLLETRITKAWRFRSFPKHELLGVRVSESTDNEPVFHHVLLLEHVPWLRDHIILGDIIFPCAGYIGMIGEAARQLCNECHLFVGFQVRHLVINTAMVLRESKPIELITSIRKQRLTDSLDSDWWEFVVSSHNGVGWMKNCTGEFRIVDCGEKMKAKKATGEATKPFSRRVDASKWYGALSNVGGNYGPYFQGLKGISCSTRDCISRGTAYCRVEDDEVPYAVHPTQIDSFLQLLGLASVKGLAHKLEEITVPTCIEHVTVIVTDRQHHPENLHMTVSASLSARGSICGGGECVTPTGQFALEMNGVNLSPLDGNADDDEDPHAGSKLFWAPDIDFLDISTLTESFADQKKYVEDCEALARLCIQEALKRLDGISTDVPHLRLFHAWMRAQRSISTNETIQSLKKKLSGTVSQPIAVALTKVLDNIVSIFTSQVEPINVLIEDNTLTQLYDTLRLTNRYQLFQSLGHSKPNLRILEIGAGTGGTTGTVLAGLVHNVTGARMYWHYDYTDISPGFFDEAKHRFKDHANIRFRVLDITKDPFSQGFEAEAYDLVIASNVLHTTPSLRDCLMNVRKLLHAEGTLYLEELCSHVKIFNYIMGVLPGWWLGADDGRTDEPYVSPERWDKELRLSGFMGLHSVVFDYPPPHQLLAIMTAKPATHEETRKRAATILYDDGASLAMAEEIGAQLRSEEYMITLRRICDRQWPLDSDLISVVDVGKPFFQNISSSSYQDFHHLVTKLSESEREPGLGFGMLWLTRPSHIGYEDPRWAEIIGAARTIRGEMAVDLATFELDTVSPGTWPFVSRIFQKFQKRRRDDTLLPEYEYALSNGTVYIPRAFPFRPAQEWADGQVAAEGGGPDDNKGIARDLKIGKYGRLKTLKWMARPGRQPTGDEVMIEPKTVGLNFKDVLIAMGVVDSTTDCLGLEAAGIIREAGPCVKDLAVGDRVFVFGAGCFSTGLIISQKYCAKIPDSLSFDEAATMPCVYSTVLHGLLDIGRLEAGQTVLIHSACGGVGLAAIQICLMVGAQIYCTVGSEEKKDHLASVFDIPRSRILYSRDSTFLDDVLAATNGRGVDLVLNSLSGDLLHASWRCVAEFGSMIEIGKRDFIGHGKLNLDVFEANRSYHGVDLGLLAERKPRGVTRLLEQIVKFYEQGLIRPIQPVQCFAASDVAKAFRLMQKGQHIGKIVVSMDSFNKTQEQQEPHQPRQWLTAKIPVPEFDKQASYLLVGGLGGLGRVISTWMVENGARRLVYLSRSAGVLDEHQLFFEELRSQGCLVTAVRGSVARLSDVEAALSAAETPVRGVINMSMVLGDRNFAQMTYEEWNKAVEPKVRGTWNLHNACLSKELDLDFFVLFSSISAIIGQRGQANYAGANSFLDAFVKYRHGLGLRAGSLAIGLITDQGVVAENQGLRDRLISQGNYGLRTPQLLDAICTAMTPATPKYEGREITHSPKPLVIGLRSVLPLDDPSNRVIWKQDRRMAAYYNRDFKSKLKGEAETALSNTTNALAEFITSARADPTRLASPESTAFVATQIGRQLLELLLRPSSADEAMDLSAPLQDVGLDSLVAIELRSWWKGVFGFDLSVLEMLSMGSLLALGERALQGLRQEGKDSTTRPEDEGVGKETFEVHEILETKMP